MPAMAAIGTALGASAGAAAGVGTMATLGTAGIAASVYGANKNAKAMKDANNANIAAQKESDALNYQRWLESRGVGSDGKPVNAWLPRYSTVNQPFGQTRRFRLRGSTTSVSPVVTGSGGMYAGGGNPYGGGQSFAPNRIRDGGDIAGFGSEIKSRNDLWAPDAMYMGANESGNFFRNA